MNLKSRIDALDVSQGLIAALSHTHESDVSRVCRGLHLAAHRVVAIERAVAELEKLVAMSSVRPDLTNPTNALAALEHAGIRAAFAPRDERSERPIASAAVGAIRTLYQPSLQFSEQK